MHKIQDISTKIHTPHPKTTKAKYYSTNTSMNMANTIENISKSQLYPRENERLSLAQHKLQTRKNMLYRFSHSAFFNHLNSTKYYQQEMDQKMNQIQKQELENLNKSRGFKGTKTHTWNQLMYLTPQKRFKNSSQQLHKVKEELYKIIKIEQCTKIQQYAEKISVKNTLIQFLTEYQTQKQPPKKQQKQNSQKNIYRKRTNSAVVRQKLKKHNKTSEYRQKIKNYSSMLNGSYF